MNYNKRIADRTRRREKWDRAVAYLGGKCVSCDSTKKLNFDHIENDRQGDKKRCIGNLVDRKWERIVFELDKCQLLCKACHGRKTAVENDKREYALHGTISMYTNNKCRCDDCREARAVHQRQYRLRIGVGLST